MYDIRQFKPILYLVLILGLTGFCIAVDSLGIWGIAIPAILLNAWLVRTGRFAPLPRWLANLVTLIALIYVVAVIYGAAQVPSDVGPPPLVHVGQFLVFLHLVKLYEQRSNRDYAQLLVLSLLLMVAAAINSTSLGFALLMLLYLALSLYCCLLFHLKVEAERARDMLAIPEDKLNPFTIRQDQRFLPTSVRRLTVMVWLVSVTTAALVFIFFPRGPGAGVLGQIQVRNNTVLTGISDDLSVDQIERIQPSEQVVARVFVYRDNVPIEGDTLYLRWSTLDTYAAGHQWLRSRWLRQAGRDVTQDTVGDSQLHPMGVPVWRQHIILEPTGLHNLLALPGLMYYPSDQGRLVAVEPARNLAVRDFPNDDSIQLQAEPLTSPLEYDVYSTNTPQVYVPPTEPRGYRRTAWGEPRDRPLSDPAVLAEIKQYALRVLPDDLAARLRPDDARPTPEEREIIARIFERHLRSEFTYTLDLTDSERLFRGVDPIVAFLTRVKRGDCKYFASAMTLMCQSLNIPARVVQGFRCDEFNAVGGHYFIVRASQAHAWVEVLVPAAAGTFEWEMFDPTSSREAPSTGSVGLWSAIKQFVDYLQYKWADTVVAYGGRDREAIIRRLDAVVVNAVIATVDFIRSLSKITYSSAFWTASLSVLNLMLWGLSLSLVGVIAWYVQQQYRLRRRAARIGLESLPVSRRMRLARQLAFYDHLVRLLDRMGVVRPRHQTHLEFSQSLVYMPTRTYSSILRLTHLFCRVRFGGARISALRQRRLDTVVARLGHTLFQRPRSRLFP